MYTSNTMGDVVHTSVAYESQFQTLHNQLYDETVNISAVLVTQDKRKQKHNTNRRDVIQVHMYTKRRAKQVVSCARTSSQNTENNRAATQATEALHNRRNAKKAQQITAKRCDGMQRESRAGD